MAAATLRERKALWRLQRRRLEQKRLDFFEADGEMWKDMQETDGLDDQDKVCFLQGISNGNIWSVHLPTNALLRSIIYFHLLLVILHR